MPSALPAIQQLERRARDYWNVDGIPTAAGGISYILLGLVLLPDWSIHHVYLSLMLGLVVFYSLSELAVHWIKGRVTYQRTGYVAPLDPNPSLIEGHFVSIRDAGLLDAERNEEAVRIHRKHLLRVAAGIVVVATLYVVGQVIPNHGLFLLSWFWVALVFLMKPDFYKLSALEFIGCPLLALLITWLPSTREHALGMIFIAAGLLSFSRGILKFFGYLWSNPSLNR